MPPGGVAVSPLKGMGFREVKVVIESKSIAPPHKVMSHPAEPALVHPITASVVGYFPYSPKRKKPLASDLRIAEKAKKPAIFTLDNLRRDALAGSITGLIAVPLTVGICLRSEDSIETGLMTVLFAFVAVSSRPYSVEETTSSPESPLDERQCWR